MAQKIFQQTFSSKFKNLSKDAVQWFPGHMGKGIKQMQHKLRTVDCIIEVHDARIPLSGRNADFKYKISGVKPHILVLNKMDLIESNMEDKIINKLKDDCNHVIFTNSKIEKCKGIRKLYPLAQDLITKSERYNRVSEEDFCVMIIGIPNVGKSSLINRLRNRYLHKGKASLVGANPGITRAVLNKIKISEDPLIYMLDTPGILSPDIKDIETGLKLALCNTIQNHLVGETIICDYLLYWLNRHNNFKYVNLYNLKSPTENIADVLVQIALNENRILKLKSMTGGYVQKPDINFAAKIMLTHFHSNKFGKIMLDQELL